MAFITRIFGSGYSTKFIVSMPTIISLGLIGGLTYTVHRNISKFFWKWIVKRFKYKKKDIKIINSDNEMKAIFSHFEREAQVIAAVGFDCEWIQMKGKRRPVALLQLATHSGLCILIRLSQMENMIPIPLKQFLENKSILKVGVGIDVDKQNLLKDHDIVVRGCVDLRHLEMIQKTICSDTKSQENQEKIGLQALAKKYLNKTLNKDWRVRAGDWEAEELTVAQIEYAAEDASVGIHILLHMMTELWKPPTLFFCWLPFSWKSYVRIALIETCQIFVDLKYGNQSSVKLLTSKKKPMLTDLPPRPTKDVFKSYSTRQTPLYHNCQLCAPDGEPLCICDPSKAFWYIEKGLGVLKSEDPLIVQLNFEPAGRPNREGTDGQFYLQERLNKCVVCGKEESYIRKNIIPHEYRKHFPRILKSHQSHDVVLLCVKCHQKSNIKDNIFRHTLAEECNALIACGTDIKETVDGKLKVVRNAGGALLKSREKLPTSRVEYLENILKNYYETENLSKDHIKAAASLDTKIINVEYTPHGFKVHSYYKKCGLIQLEQRWREWFLNSMSPKYMPDKWSVTHNHSKLKIKMSRYPLTHPLREDYKEALVGTEGFIDIPYVATENGCISNFFGVGKIDSKELSPE